MSKRKPKWQTDPILLAKHNAAEAAKRAKQVVTKPIESLPAPIQQSFGFSRPSRVPRGPVPSRRFERRR